MNPNNTIFDAKRLIGRKFDDPTVQMDIKHWPFTVINDGTKPKIQVDYKCETKEFSAEEVSSMVLTKMKETAEAYLGVNVKDAVVTGISLRIIRFHFASPHCHTHEFYAAANLQLLYLYYDAIALAL